jgi:3',5'-cyclic AMP phosphodiesterase CpdA
MRALLALALLALAAPGCGGDESAAAPPATGSTLRATLADPDGDGALDPGPAEPLRDRGGRARPGRTLATFAQLTDSHVRDEESPARVPFLDRLGVPFDSTFRPHEALSTQVLAASVRALNRLRPQAVVVTGDIVDSAQANELEQALAVLDGGRVRPDSGARGYSGVQLGANPDPLYYRPDNDAPRHPGLLARAQAPFTAPGLRAPWFPALGNHDLLVAGEVAPTPRLAEVATGGEAVVGLDPAFRPTEDLDAGATLDALLAGGELPGRTTRVAPDPDRRHVGVAEVVARLGERVDAPFPDRLDYRFDIAPGVRGIVLDTVRRAGGSRGIVSPEQVAWLREELDAAGDAWVLVFSHNPLDASDGGGAALAALAASPRVVAAIAGHRHRNAITRAAGGGAWLVGTSSLADFPQQARAFRLREAAGGGAVLETWMVDHDGAGLAGTARELAYLDAQGGRPKGFAGGRGDRNVRLHVPAP